MRKFTLAAVAILTTAFLAGAQETPKSMAATYSSLADAILAVKKTEANFVRGLLDGHMHGAQAYFMAKDYEKAAAEMALFGNEGDNAVAGVRKRLLEGGHHHNAEGEAKGIYEPGYVIVTKKAKQQILAASSALRSASDDAGRKAAWDAFKKAADSLAAKE
ncbi:MAG: hypothetical protein ACYTGZ_20925 [Planctomycetota bacterium]|jgi:hypothetical protein